jgi:hypothetical protein
MNPKLLTRRSALIGLGSSIAMPADAGFVLGKAGGGGGGYIAKAVHFDGTNLNIASLSAIDNEFVSFNVWLRTAVNGYQVIGVVDQENNYATTISTRGPSAPAGTAALTCYPASGSGGVDISVSPSSVDYWYNLIGTAKTNEVAGAKILKLYLNDIDLGTITDVSPSFTMSFNGKSFFIGDDTQGGPFIGDMADLWIAPGVSLLTGNDIAVATRRLFISASGKPVNPSGFPNSAMLFSGDATTFVTNQGTGGAFTLAGILTNATTSPSD